MVRVLFSLAVFWFFPSCNKNETKEIIYVPPKDTVSFSSGDTAKTYLALGDSYTIGQSVSQSERFPPQTNAFLKGDGIKMSEPIYIAQTGWTTANLLSAIAAQNPLPVFDVVTLLIGVNDQYQRMDTGGYTQRFTQLLEKSIQLAKGRKMNVFVLSIPDYSATPFVPEAESK